MMPETTATPQSCRELFISLGAGANKALTADQQSDCAHIGKIMTAHPLLGLAIQHIILASYQRATWTDLDGAIDWQSVIAWFVANAPTILQTVLSILAMFAA